MQTQIWPSPYYCCEQSGVVYGVGKSIIEAQIDARRYAKSDAAVRRMMLRNISVGAAERLLADGFTADTYVVTRMGVVLTSEVGQ